MSLMGLDVGTTGCKAAVFDPSGRMIAGAYREYPLLHPQPGWSELDINGLWNKVQEVIKEVNSSLSSDPVSALSVSCQGEAVTPINKSGQPLYNFSVSFDHRTVKQAEWWQISHLPGCGMNYLTPMSFFLSDAREKLEKWRVDYNYQRPHKSLNYSTPVEFLRIQKAKEFNLSLVQF